jgi:HK97 family phage portal protein
MQLNLQQRLKVAWNVLRNKYIGDGYDFVKWFSPSNIFASRTGNILATNETIFAAITRLSNAMASLPLKLYRDFTPVNNRISDMLANSPNPNMTSFEFIRTLEVMRDTFGNGYALKMYDVNYQVESLLLLDPARVEPVIEENTYELWYEVQGKNGLYYVHNMDMIHVKHIAATGQTITYNSVGYKGISPIDVLRNTVDYDWKVRTFSLEQMDSAIRASFILKMNTTLSKEKKAEILNNFKEFYQANGGVIIQEAGTEINPIERSIIDTKVFEVEKITRSRVATVFNMPVHMLGEIEGASYSSMEQLYLEFVQGTLLPIVRQYEQEFNRKLLTEQERLRGLTFKFNVNALLRGDIKTRGEFYFKGIRSGWFTPNEVRAYEELPPLDGGEKLYMSKDLSPIDDPNRKGVSPTNEPANEPK